MKYILFGTVIPFIIYYTLGYLNPSIDIPNPNYIVCLITALLLFFVTIYLTKRFYQNHKALVLIYYVVASALFLYLVCNFLYEFLYLITPYNPDDPCYTEGNADIIAIFLSLLVWGVSFDVVKNRIGKIKK